MQLLGATETVFSGKDFQEGKQMFANRLNFLMDVTNIRNSAMANAVALDASHISRLRHGGRKLPQNQTFLQPMALYITKQIKGDYQKKIIMEALDMTDGWPDDDKIVAKIINDWLEAGDDESHPFTSPISKSYSLSTLNSSEERTSPLRYSIGETDFFYGNEGKRKAAMRLFSEVLQENSPQTVYICCEEDSRWFFEDSIFSKKLSSMAYAALERGIQVITIHSLNRDIYETMDIIFSWLSMYSTGRVTPFYYPKGRDSVFKHTLVVARKTAAFSSHSLMNSMDDMLNLYTKDKVAIKAYINEFQNYLAICRPLLNVYNRVNAELFWPRYEAMLESPGNITRVDMLPFYSFAPEQVFDSMSRRRGNDKISVKARFSKKAALHSLQEYHFTDVFTLLDRDSISSFRLFLCEMADGTEIRYTFEEYIMHLDNIVMMLRKYPNYDVCLRRISKEEPSILAKENCGVIITKFNVSSTVYMSTEKPFVEVMWEYLEDKKAKNVQRSIVGKERVIRTIKDHIKYLKGELEFPPM